MDMEENTDDYCGQCGMLGGGDALGCTSDCPGYVPSEDDDWTTYLEPAPVEKDIKPCVEK